MPDKPGTLKTGMDRPQPDTPDTGIRDPERPEEPGQMPPKGGRL